MHFKKAVAWILKVKNTLLGMIQMKREQGVTIALSDADEVKQTKQLHKSVTSCKPNLGRESVTADDLKKAELEIIRYCQNEEINSLKKGEPIKGSSHLYKLNPVLQDGILRVGGRLHRAAMPEESKHPAILANDLRVSEFIIQEVHKEVGHSRRNHILSKLHLKYWIPNVSTVIRRKVLAKCVVCRRLHGVNGQQPLADQPQNRLLPDYLPFSRTGVNLFGPFEIKRGRVTVNRYGVIFTCLAIRADHLEVAASLETDSFINALRRFIAQRGQALELRSDNGTNFTGAERELKRTIQDWNASKIEDTLLQ